jgi:hypothetical protein
MDVSPVTAVPTTTTVAANPNPATVGQPVTLTATITPAASGPVPPTGSVDFFDATTGTDFGQAPVSNGTATLGSVAFATVGSQTITATYSGDDNYIGSSGSTTEMVNQQAATTTAIASSPNPSTVGQPVTFTATVSPSATTSGLPTPTGTVTFMDGSAPIGTGTLDGTGTATFQTSTLTADPHSITAVYGGDSNYSGSSGSTTQTVNKATPTVSVSDAGGTYNGMPFPATAMVAGVVAGVDSTPVPSLEGVTPTLSYYDANGNLLPGAPMDAGTYSVVATFPGSADYTAASSSRSSFTIAQATPTVAVDQVSTTYDGQAHGTTGTVTGVNGISLGAATISYNTNDGNAPVNAGSYVATGSFAGDNDYTSATGTAAIVISQASADILVNGYTGVYDGNAHGASLGHATGVKGEDLSSLVSLGSSFTDVPGGTANWSFAGNTDYKSASGTASIMISQTDATITVNGYTGVYDGNAHGATGSATGVKGEDLSSLLNLGSSFTDVPGGKANWSFAGNTDYESATGTAAIVISMASTETMIEPSADLPVYGQPVTFTATVTVKSPGAGIPTGTVTFTQTYPPSNPPVTYIEPLYETGSAQFTAQFTTSTLPAAIISSFTAAYSGNNNFGSSTSTDDASVLVRKKSLTVAANNVSRVYGVANPIFTAAYTGFVNGENLATSGVTGSPVLNTAATAGSAPGTYTIATGLGTLAANNYSFNLVNGILTVTPAPLSATGVNFTATAGAPFSGTVATFINADPFGSAASYTATITWGDGAASAGTITGTGSTLAVIGSHTYADPVNEVVKVTISHKLGYTASATVSDVATVTSLGQGVQHGLTGGIGFWQSKQGQALINSFNGGSASTALSAWLAASFPNLYGATAGAHNLTGETNAQVGAFFQGVFSLPPPQADAQVLAVALNVYATTSSLGGTAGVAYGFTVSVTGLGALSYNVGNDGAAFGVANNTTLNVYQLLRAVNKKAVKGALYNGDATLQAQAADLFNSLNKAGTIG